MRPYDVKLGQHVKVVYEADEILDRRYIGQVGIVYKIQTSGAGVGESGNDPYILVQFSKGVHDGFWAEELELATGSTTEVPDKPVRRYPDVRLIEAYTE